jgi:hypothetical protein
MDKNNSFTTKEFEPDAIWTGTPSRIGKLHNTIKVAYHNTAGKLRIYQSPNGKLWDYYDSETDISGNGYKQVGINGNYFYVWYEHLTGTNTITLTTNLSSQIHDQFDVKLTPNDTVTVDGLQFNESGALIVTGGTGGSGGDASSVNQVSSNLAICTRLDGSNLALYTQLETQTDRLLYDLDIIANRLYEIEGNVEVTNQITGYATSQLQESSNIAQWTKLNLIEQGTEINAGYLQSISTRLTPLQQGVARYDLSARTTLSPDTVPAYSTSPSGIPASEGWYYKNLALGNTSQLYYYANQSSQTRNHDYTISAIESQWAVVRLLNLNSGTSVPYLMVYSQPQADGLDIIPGFARSSWVYQLATGQELRLGEKVILFRGTQPDPRIYPELRRVECSLTVTRGPALTSELLAYATLNSDSGAPVNTVEYIVGGAGLSFAGDHVYKVELTAESAATAGSDASAENQVSSNTAVCARLDNSVGELSNITAILSDTINVINYGLLNDTPQYIPIRASSTGNLFVYDSQTYSELLTLNAEIDGVIEDGSIRVVGTFFQASQPVEFTTAQDVNLYAGAGLTHTETASGQFSLDVNVNNSTDIPVSGLFFQETQPVSIARLGFTAGDELIVYDDYSFQELQTLNGKITKCDTDNVIISGSVDITSATALSVTETSPITGFALETTLDDVKTQTDKLTFIDIDTNTNNLKVIDTALNTQLGQFSFFTGDDEITDLRVRVMNTAVDANITTDAGALTSTSVTGTETYNALHVLTKGTTAVSGIVKTQAQDSNNTQVANNVSVTGPSRVGNADADTQGYLWVSAIFQFSSVTTGGQIYLEVSHDGNIWARPSSASVFVMTSVAQTSGSIILAYPIPFMYVRLWADTGFVGLGCSAWIVMK